MQLQLQKKIKMNNGTSPHTRRGDRMGGMNGYALFHAFIFQNSLN
jgi:hypothetical protein